MACSCHQLYRKPDRVEDNTTLDAGLFAVYIVSSNSGNDVVSIFVSFVGEQPSGALRKPDHSGGDNNAEDNLKGDREAPD